MQAMSLQCDHTSWFYVLLRHVRGQFECAHKRVAALPEQHCTRARLTALNEGAAVE